MSSNFTQAQTSNIKSQFEGYSDAGLGGRRDALEEDYGVKDAYLALSDIGLELCGDCGIWHDNRQCATSSPDDVSLFICDDCARDRGLT